ncbi:hypothetical protein NEFER03_1206 [Nematocida sp. LUAm3]|nr:hypothetical protein NEFER03_1206 [Nematocida sp. LUAm3]KAI5175815.1 hypothetical protein NEFER02_1684 [Nematocida sp. LUAm2]KAI5178311.1 hypothetical protein NEFER01_1478 [Nematocida sp. LUAm1]
MNRNTYGLLLLYVHVVFYRYAYGFTGASEDRADISDLNMFDTEGYTKSQHIMEKPDSFFSVIEKMIHKYPYLKSKLYIFFKQQYDQSSSFLGGNPATTLSGDGTHVPDPYEIYKRFKSIVEADQMLKDDLRALLRQVQEYTDQLRLKKRKWGAAIKDLTTDMDSLIKQKERAQNRIVSSDIDAKFAAKRALIHTFIKGYENAQKWEKRLNSLLEELFP